MGKINHSKLNKLKNTAPYEEEKWDVTPSYLKEKRKKKKPTLKKSPIKAALDAPSAPRFITRKNNI